MYAYSMAAAHEKLPHLRMDNWMVSNTEAGGEGWAWIDALEDPCMPPNDEVGIHTSFCYKSFFNSLLMIITLLYATYFQPLRVFFMKISQCLRCYTSVSSI